MELEQASNPFLDLPGALVEEVLQRTGDVGRTLLDSFEEVRNKRQILREQLRNNGLLSLATRAPHDAIFLDCSVTTPAIYLNQALSRANEAPGLRISALLVSRAAA